MTARDRALLETLKARLGLKRNMDVIRLALRTLDAQGPAERRQTDGADTGVEPTGCRSTREPQ